MFTVTKDDMTMRAGAVSPGNKSDISYEKKLEWAKYHAEETYKKYAGINEHNWADYIKDMM